MAFQAESLALPPWSIDPADENNPAPALGDLLVAPARKWPDRTAINDGDVSYTFAQLEQGAQAVAARLTEQGVGAGDRVAILAEKRAVMPMIALGVWKCGAVYAPLDASEPVDRLRGLLTRLEPVAVIALDDRDPIVPTDRWLGKKQLDAVLSGPATHSTVPHRPDQAVYIIFASGSTGEPQGVENSAAGLLAYFGNHNQVLRFTAESRVLSLSPFHVDVSFEDTLLPLSLGAFVYQFRNLPAGAIMRSVLGRERITHLIAVSMLLAMITGDGRQITRAKLPGVETVMTGAQVCDPAVMRIWKQQLPETRVVHAFGPPEATIFCLTYEIEDEAAEGGAAYPIGRPLRGMDAKIMKDGVELHQPGAQGELWVGGAQVMRGYFDDPGETARLVVDVDGTPYFRTGDICSYADDGNIVFHRHDDGEIRWLAGRRTHLSEIRRAALSCPGVDRALVAVVQRNQRDVVALVVTSEAQRVVADVEAHLGGLLPGYMRPTLFAWSPAVSAASTAEADERQLVQRLAAAAQQSNSNYFARSADGAVEPIEKVEPCL
ncbi:amino acid adenylation protein [Streptomyces sp. CB02959]|uniref:AMP-binding protein n=1 Tax=Streptomyces sp. CB02959 TaxID=2020330 RepID=UPI000C27A592|nr:AMP-binding protein [Streptomyces sp. CB02959]PJN36372.1 amino acid adenylation protein [Streptomyces sp. CB02959]